MRSLFLVPFLLLAGSAARGADTPFPPLPQVFSSFGAATAGGYAYVYGGHVGKTHGYSTETSTGLFRRLSLTKPQAGWEELPAGDKCQGLTLVALEMGLIARPFAISRLMTKAAGSELAT